MLQRILFLVALIIGFIHFSNGQIQKAGIPGTYMWGGFSSDATGTYLTAAQEPSSPIYNSPQMIYYSMNGGSTWQASTAPAVGYYCIASASSAPNYVVAGSLNAIYVSTNYGQSFTQTSTFNANYAATVSANGQYMAVSTSSSGCMAYSSDFGSTWTTNLTPSGLTSSCTSVSMSSNGATIVLGTNANGVYVSTNGGTSWTQTYSTTQEISTVAFGDGLFYAAMYGSPYYVLISSNSGSSWSVTSGSTTGSMMPWELAVAANLGSYVVSAATELYLSTNSGTTYTELTGSTKTRSVAVNGDGTLTMFNAGNNSVSYLYFGNLATITPTAQPTLVPGASTTKPTASPTVLPADPSYAISKFYSDSTCSQFTSMQSLVTGVCLRSGPGSYFKVSCGSNSLVTASYSDSSCTTSTGTNTYTLNQGCNVNGGSTDYYNPYFIAIDCGASSAYAGYGANIVTETYYEQNGNACHNNEIITVYGYLNDVCLPVDATDSGKVSWADRMGYSYTQANCQGTPTSNALTVSCTTCSGNEYGIPCSYYWQAPSDSGTTDSALSVGAIAGIAIGGVGFLVILAVVAYFVFFSTGEIAMSKQENSVPARESELSKA